MVPYVISGLCRRSAYDHAHGSLATVRVVQAKHLEHWLDIATMIVMVVQIHQIAVDGGYNFLPLIGTSNSYSQDVPQE